MAKKIAIPHEIALYKAFVTIGSDVDETNADMMIVDTSGDEFGISPEDAIRILYQTIPYKTLYSMNMMEFLFGPNDETIQQDEGVHTPNVGEKLIMLKVIPNKPSELKNAIISGDIGKDCQISVALANLPSGVTNCLAEYIVAHTKVWLKSTVPDPENTTMVAFKGERCSHETDQFPAKIDFKVAKSQRNLAYHVPAKVEKTEGES